MNLSNVAEVKELSETVFTEPADSAGTSTAGIFQDERINLWIKSEYTHI